MTAGILPNGYLDLVTSGLDANLPTAANTLVPSTKTAFYYATDTGILYRWTGTAWDATQPKTVAVGAAVVAKAIAGITYLLDTAAGSVLTLPAATGSGIVIEAAVIKTATSNAHKILTAPVTDKLIGTANGATVTSKAAILFSAASAGAFHSIQMPFAGTQPSGGFEGDNFSFQDIAAGLWLVSGQFQSGTTPTTPFSTATT